MDSANRDEAVRCLEFAKGAVRKGDLAKAIRLTEKSLRLCHTEQGKEFLQQLLNKEKNNNGSGSNGVKSEGERVGKGEDEGARRRRGKSEDGEGKDKAKEEAEFTPEQKKAVNKLLRCKDYYEILGVSRDASEADLKKQYRRLALQFHPDKNRAPRADEAFKAISNAYAILSDADKRSKYDQFGEEGLSSRQSPYHFSRGFESDLSPEDLFRMFFGDGLAPMNRNFYYTNNGTHYFYQSHNRPHMRTHRHHDRNHIHTHQEPTNPWVKFCQMLPILLIIFVSVFSNILFSFLGPTVPFSLARTREYNVKRVIVDRHEIPYYVQESFVSEFKEKSAILEVERQVLEEYVWRLRVQCEEERYRQAFRRARRSKDSKSLPEPCKKLQQFVASGKG